MERTGGEGENVYIYFQIFENSQIVRMERTGGEGENVYIYFQIFENSQIVRMERTGGEVEMKIPEKKKTDGFC